MSCNEDKSFEKKKVVSEKEEIYYTHLTQIINRNDNSHLLSSFTIILREAIGRNISTVFTYSEHTEREREFYLSLILGREEQI